MSAPYVSMLRAPRAVTFAFNGTLARNVVGGSRYAEYAEALLEPKLFQDRAAMETALTASVDRMQTKHMNFGRNVMENLPQDHWWRLTIRDMLRSMVRKHLEAEALTATEAITGREKEFESKAAAKERMDQEADNQFIGPGFEKVYQKIMRDLKHPPYWCVFDDVNDALTKIKSRGMKIGIISNFDETLDDLVNGCHSDSGSLSSLVDFVVGSRKTGFMKPDQTIYRRAAELAEVEPQRMLHVGAHPSNDFFGPPVCGFETVFLHRSPSARTLDAKLSHLQTDRAVNNLGEVADAVELLLDLEKEQMELEAEGCESEHGGEGEHVHKGNDEDDDYDDGDDYGGDDDDDDKRP